MEANTTEAKEFLERFYPEGPWVIIAIELDGQEIQTRTFYPDETEDMRDWILAQQKDQKNMYFQVNPFLGLDPAKKDRTFKKASRVTIKELKVVHVDVDPRAKEDLGKEQKRIQKLATTPIGDVPLPSIAIWSGGGIQFLWLLSDPPQMDGTLETAEELKLHNLRLEQVYGADNCHNIDRILRLPGTINYPDKAKRKKGRKIARSRVLLYDQSKVYSIDQFPKAVLVQDQGRRTVSTKAKFDTGTVDRNIDLDSLEGVEDWVKMLIVQGYDPNGANEHLRTVGYDPNKWDSRSEVVWAVTCHLIQKGVPDEVVYAILTDRDYGITEHIFDQKVGAEKYALRQIQNAHENSIDPILREFNEKHCVIEDMGGLCRIVSEVWEPVMKRHNISVQSFADFRNRYAHRKVKIGEKKGVPVYVPAGKWWVEHPLRQQRNTLVFAPGQDPEDAYNLWTGYACEAIRGDCSLYLTHVLDNICSKNQVHYDYIENWMAMAVQYPDRPGLVAIILRGRQGTGKSLFVKTFGNLFGRHFLQVSDAKHLVGSFNAHLRDCVVLFGDEAFYAGDRKHESTLKTLVTEEYMAVEAKGVDVVAAHNFTHILLASNNTWVVPANSDERRFLVLDVEDSKMQDEEYFTKILHQLDNGGREALLYHLMNKDISDFQVRTVPKTEALQEQKMLSMSVEHEWWYTRLCDGTVLTATERWEGEVKKDHVFTEYIDYAKQVSNLRPLNKTAFGKFLVRVCPKVNTRQGRDTSTSGSFRPWFYEFPTLLECRKFFDRNFGGPYQWDEIGVRKDPNF